MKVDVELEIDFPSESLTRSTYSSLVPDNVSLPECMKLNMSKSKNSVIVHICSTCGEDTLISTAEDILMSCELSLRAIETVGET